MSFKSAASSWSAEVEREAERLIDSGVPPWDAIVQARQIVAQRRHIAGSWRKETPDACESARPVRRVLQSIG